MAMTGIFSSGKKSTQGFSGDHLQEKHRRIAAESLHDLLQFHAKIDEEMQSMLADVKQGKPLDAALFEKMVKVKETYLQMMHGLKDLDYENESHALIIFADAVQDMLAHLNRKRRH